MLTKSKNILQWNNSQSIYRVPVNELGLDILPPKLIPHHVPFDGRERTEPTFPTIL